MNFDFSSQHAALPSSPGPQTTAPFGLIVPGSPVRVNFAPADSTGLRFALALTPSDFPGPLATITEIVFFLMPNTPLPPDHGVVCYWQIAATTSPSPGVPPPSTGFQPLGSITPDRPSTVFQTGWSEHEQVVEVSSSGQPVIVTIGASLEPLQTIQNMGIDVHKGRLYVAQKIASDLFKFMQSFDTGTGGAGQMVVPTNIFERWWQRFSKRFERDPNFFLRSSD